MAREALEAERVASVPEPVLPQISPAAPPAADAEQLTLF
jgi:hypothetical protein